jgi:DNA polymerase III epsilon subunit-like protein
LVENYFDIETTGLDPKHDKIITVQIQKLEGRTTEPIGEMEILKEWESSEKEILQKIMPLLTCENPFDFIIVGRNLPFDFMFVSERAKKYRLKAMDLSCLRDRAFIDLKHVLVLINEGTFRYYDRLLKKGKHLNVNIPELYRQKKYKEITRYVKEESEIFIEAYRKLKKEMPSLAKYL